LRDAGGIVRRDEDERYGCIFQLRKNTGLLTKEVATFDSKVQQG